MAIGREEWKRIVRQAKTQTEVLRYEKLEEEEEIPRSPD
jgi:hypothetical protein